MLPSLDVHKGYQDGNEFNKVLNGFFQVVQCLTPFKNETEKKTEKSILEVYKCWQDQFEAYLDKCKTKSTLYEQCAKELIEEEGEVKKLAREQMLLRAMTASKSANGKNRKRGKNKEITTAQSATKVNDNKSCDQKVIGHSNAEFNNQTVIKMIDWYFLYRKKLEPHTIIQHLKSILADDLLNLAVAPEQAAECYYSLCDIAYVSVHSFLKTGVHYEHCIDITKKVQGKNQLISDRRGNGKLSDQLKRAVVFYASAEQFLPDILTVVTDITRKFLHYYQSNKHLELTMKEAHSYIMGSLSDLEILVEKVLGRLSSV